MTMNRNLFVLVLSFFLVLKTSAQISPSASTEKEKRPAKNSPENPGMNKSTGGRFIQGPPRKKVIAVPAPDLKSTPSANYTLNAYAGSTSKVQHSEKPVLYNYDKLPVSVKQKLDANKAAGRPIMTGICKRYDISIPSIQTAEDLRSSLTDLSRNGSVLKTTFISSGKIYVLAKPEMASEELKAILSSKNVSFDFLQEQFQLIQ